MLGPAVVCSSGARPTVEATDDPGGYHAARRTGGPGGRHHAGIFVLVTGSFLRRNHDVFGALAGPVSELARVDERVFDPGTGRQCDSGGHAPLPGRGHGGERRSTGSCSGWCSAASNGGATMQSAHRTTTTIQLRRPVRPRTTGDYRLTQDPPRRGAPMSARRIPCRSRADAALVAGVWRRARRGDTDRVEVLASTLANRYRARLRPVSSRVHEVVPVHGPLHHIVLLVLWCRSWRSCSTRHRLLPVSADMGALVVVAAMPQFLDHVNRLASSIPPRVRDRGVHVVRGRPEPVRRDATGLETATRAISGLRCEQVGIANWIIASSIQFGWGSSFARVERCRSSMSSW